MCGWINNGIGGRLIELDCSAFFPWRDKATQGRASQGRMKEETSRKKRRRYEKEVSRVKDDKSTTVKERVPRWLETIDKWGRRGWRQGVVGVWAGSDREGQGGKGRKKKERVGFVRAGAASLLLLLRRRRPSSTQPSRIRGIICCIVIIGCCMVLLYTALLIRAAIMQQSLAGWPRDTKRRGKRRSWLARSERLGSDACTITSGLRRNTSHQTRYKLHAAS